MKTFGALVLFSGLLFSITWTELSAQTVSTSCAAKSNTSCEECLSNITCLWCIQTQQCVDYPVHTILPPHSLCPLSSARWGECWVDFQALIITVCVIGGAIIISIFICCFCCCKCENIGRSNKQSEQRAEREAEQRRARHDERRAEMRSRHEEIRMKYGLTRNNPYSKFENN